ncbi:cobalamin biosynthesis protein CobW [Hansschlegelia plantiphila]|uniref:Cobalamin biosynthesis protein CobW n=1 Tax=Hansschlegelia plantiphila TaxID=374655 RepID=A0A9W6J303_9HYPH|nr:cobalamin biosynthesis protein CobW [Hansschlegelia plantiphila]
MTVLTGYLGAGKTTILNGILGAPRGARRYGVVVNEFGEIGVDGELIVGADEAVVELANGCLCCSVRGDLIGALETLLARDAGLDAILIETTGLADPAPIAATFLLDDDLSDHIRLDGVVCVVDAVHLAESIEGDPAVAAQIAFADLLLLTKADVASPSQRTEAEGIARALNAAAPLVHVTRGAVDPQALFDLRGFDLRGPRNRFVAAPAAVEPSRHQVSSLALTTDRELDPDRFMSWMQTLIRRSGGDILRSKGVVALSGENRRFVFHGVQTMLEGDVQEPWPIGDERRSRLVFIGRNLDEAALRDGFAACLAPEDGSSASEGRSAAAA